MIDIGANLAHDSFDNDRDQVLQRAWDGGLESIVVTGSSLESARRALELATQDPRLYSTAGLHPHHADEWDATHEATFRELAQDPKLVALGECGLDYFRNFSPHPVQLAAFRAQLDLAVDLKKPVFLHQRDAHADFLPILTEYRPHLADVVVHCFTDTRAAMEAYLALDCHIGITGWICDERRGRELFDSAKHIPDERLLIETDAPYLLPRTAPKQPHRRNEPAFLSWVVKSLAQARGQDEAHVARITADNARRFFRLPAR